MNKQEFNKLTLIIIVFTIFYFLPIQYTWFNESIFSALNLMHEYAKEHVLTCLIPALFIAGAIATFIKKDAILKYLGQKVNKIISYTIASTSGILLAVCSCTILPLFAGIRKRGAGLGPAITFLFSGPAINIAAIFLTFSVLGTEIGVARIISSILIAILAGLSMHFIFKEKVTETDIFINNSADKSTNNNKTSILIIGLLSILIVNGLKIDQGLKYFLMMAIALFVTYISLYHIKKEKRDNWLRETWSLSKMILPLLFVGVLIAGFISPLLPQEFIERIVGSNTLASNLIASLFGSLMYFSTLTEIPIIQELIGKGMHKGPVLALLLSGPSLSLPNMLVIRNVLGNKKTLSYILLVITYSSIAGYIFGNLN